jgi:hypothetical protein
MITTLTQAEKNKLQPTDRHHTDNRTLNQGKERPPQATPAAPKPWQATARKSGTHKPDSEQEPHSVPVGTSKKLPPGDSQRGRRRESAQGTKVQHDGPVEVSTRLDGGRHRGVTGVQICV